MNKLILALFAAVSAFEKTGKPNQYCKTESPCTDGGIWDWDACMCFSEI